MKVENTPNLKNPTTAESFGVLQDATISKVSLGILLFSGVVAAFHVCKFLGVFKSFGISPHLSTPFPSVVKRSRDVPEPEETQDLTEKIFKEIQEAAKEGLEVFDKNKNKNLLAKAAIRCYYKKLWELVVKNLPDFSGEVIDVLRVNADGLNDRYVKEPLSGLECIKGLLRVKQNEEIIQAAHKIKKGFLQLEVLSKIAPQDEDVMKKLCCLALEIHKSGIKWESLD